MATSINIQIWMLINSMVIILMSSLINYLKKIKSYVHRLNAHRLNRILLPSSSYSTRVKSNFFNSSYLKSNNLRACLGFTKISTLIIFQLTGMCCLHQMWTLPYYIKLSLTQNFASFLYSYLALKKIPKNKIKFKDKPWITSGLQKSISVKTQNLS